MKMPRVGISKPHFARDRGQWKRIHFYTAYTDWTCTTPQELEESYKKWSANQMKFPGSGEARIYDPVCP